MRILQNPPATVLGMGVLTIVNDKGKLKRYELSGRLKKPAIPDLLAIEKKGIDFVEGHHIDGEKLPNKLVLADQARPEKVNSLTGDVILGDAVVVLYEYVAKDA